MAKRKHQAPHIADTKAVSGISGFAGLPKCVLKSEAYRTLGLMARSILTEIIGTLDGHNNGAITISYAQLAARLNRRNQSPIGPAIAELMDHGLVDLSAESVWRERKAREYRLTFVNTTDSIGRTIKPTNDYLQWRAKNDATDGVAAKAETATDGVADGDDTATDGVATPNGKLPKTFRRSATNGVVPICKPYVGCVSEPAKPAGQPNLTPKIADDPIATGKAA